MCALHLAHLTSVRTRSGFLRSNNRLVPDFFADCVLFCVCVFFFRLVRFRFSRLEFLIAFAIVGNERVI